MLQTFTRKPKSTKIEAIVVCKRDSPSYALRIRDVKVKLMSKFNFLGNIVTDDINDEKNLKANRTSKICLSQN